MPPSSGSGHLSEEFTTLAGLHQATLESEHESSRGGVGVCPVAPGTWQWWAAGGHQPTSEGCGRGTSSLHCPAVPGHRALANTTPEERHSRVILSPKNVDTLDINEDVLLLLPGEVVTYYSADSVTCENEEEAQQYPMEYLHTLTPSGLPKHTLNLKIGAIIMLLRNLDLRQGLCNGSRLVVRRLHQNSIDAELITGVNTGARVLIPRIKLAPSDVGMPFTLERRQFPVR